MCRFVCVCKVFPAKYVVDDHTVDPSVTGKDARKGKKRRFEDEEIGEKGIIRKKESK